jgi:hypothetical protein
MKPQLSNWFEAPGPVLVKSQRAPDPGLSWQVPVLVKADRL